VQNNINGRQSVTSGNVTTVSFANRSLGGALIAAIPAVNTGSAAASLSSLAQDQAIESARVGTVNGLSILRNGDFGNRSKN
jgi:hypothetical protein